MSTSRTTSACHETVVSQYRLECCHPDRVTSRRHVQAVCAEQFRSRTALRVDHGRADIDKAHTRLAMHPVLDALIGFVHLRPELLAGKTWLDRDIDDFHVRQIVAHARSKSLEIVNDLGRCG